MASTYESIATTTVSGSSTPSITFNSFSGYTDLVIVGVYGWQAIDKYLSITFNSDTTASNYSSTTLNSNGAGGTSTRFTGSLGTIDLVGLYGANSALTSIININLMNYSNSNTYKTFISRASDYGSNAQATVGLWRNTNAITSFTLTDYNGSNFYNGSKFSLYGIKAA